MTIPSGKLRLIGHAIIKRESRWWMTIELRKLFRRFVDGKDKPNK